MGKKKAKKTEQLNTLSDLQCVKGMFPAESFDMSMPSQAKSVYLAIERLGGLDDGTSTTDKIVELSTATGRTETTVLGWLKDLDDKAERMQRRNALRHANKIVERYNRDHASDLKKIAKMERKIDALTDARDTLIKDGKKGLADLVDLDGWMSVGIADGLYYVGQVKKGGKSGKRGTGGAPRQRASYNYNAEKTYVLESSFHLKDKNDEPFTVPYTATITRRETVNAKGAGTPKAWRCVAKSADKTCKAWGNTMNSVYRASSAELKSYHDPGKTYNPGDINVNVPLTFDVPKIVANVKKAKK